MVKRPLSFLSCIKKFTIFHHDNDLTTFFSSICGLYSHYSVWLQSLLYERPCLFVSEFHTSRSEMFEFCFFKLASHFYLRKEALSVRPSIRRSIRPRRVSFKTANSSQFKSFQVNLSKFKKNTPFFNYWPVHTALLLMIPPRDFINK